jgi:hypothetical protein
MIQPGKESQQTARSSDITCESKKIIEVLF